jgi:hypothetical protein
MQHISLGSATFTWLRMIYQMSLQHISSGSITHVTWLCVTAVQHKSHVSPAYDMFLRHIPYGFAIYITRPCNMYCMALGGRSAKYTTWVCTVYQVALQYIPHGSATHIKWLSTIYQMALQHKCHGCPTYIKWLCSMYDMSLSHPSATYTTWICNMHHMACTMSRMALQIYHMVWHHMLLGSTINHVSHGSYITWLCSRYYIS